MKNKIIKINSCYDRRFREFLGNDLYCNNPDNVDINEPNRLRKCLDSYDIPTWCRLKLDVSELYNELLIAVGNKFSNESRHQTALRYIRQAEKIENNPPKQNEKLSNE
jgi:hypothetical protein